MRRKVTFMRVEKTKQPLPENGHIFATMPLRRIVPNPCNPEWKPATCPICGQDCWLQTGNAELVKQIYPSAKFVCSECCGNGGGEPVSEYRAIYKCRLCGTVFVHHAHANDEDEAAKKIVDFALFYSGADVHRRKIPLILQFHKCSDASYGVADFQGMKKVGGSDG